MAQGCASPFTLQGSLKARMAHQALSGAFLRCACEDIALPIHQVCCAVSPNLGMLQERFQFSHRQRHRRHQDAVGHARFISNRDPHQIRRFAPSDICHRDHRGILTDHHLAHQIGEVLVLLPLRRTSAGDQYRPRLVDKDGFTHEQPAEISGLNQVPLLRVRVPVMECLLRSQGRQGISPFLQQLLYVTGTDGRQRLIPLRHQVAHGLLVAVRAGKAHTDEYQREGKYRPENDLKPQSSQATGGCGSWGMRCCSVRRMGLVHSNTIQPSFSASVTASVRLPTPSLP